MRVIGGTCGGRKLTPPKGDKIRPTLDKVKGAVFSILQPVIYDAKFLDLFGGSGGMAIEALSRGARSAVICDISKEAVSLISRNLDTLNLSDRAQVIKGGFESALKTLQNAGKCFDIIYIDPPYGSGLEDLALKKVAEYGILSDGGTVIVEYPPRKELILPPKTYIISSTRTFGDTAITVLNRNIEDDLI